MYDLIGDIHGHADELIRLLQHLGYTRTRGAFRHPERKVIFLGDFIDRGPQIRLVLKTVRDMVEAGSALAVMGNHELNALAYHTPNEIETGQALRVNCEKNRKQHRATLDQLGPDMGTHLKWFRTLPLWLDLDGLRAVHACWDDEAMAAIAKLHGGLNITDEFLHAACRKQGSIFERVEVLLKGREAKLPDGLSFFDKDGHERHSIRTRWYMKPHEFCTYAEFALQTDPVPCHVPLDDCTLEAARPYPATEKPVFVGHYWLKDERPAVLAPNVACLDYSVAKGGFLCAYRWQGERTLTDEHFVHAG
ncbi:MAG: metallophosphoesterase [Gemmataceae bacterium]